MSDLWLEDPKDNEGNTPLHIACVYGNLEILKQGFLNRDRYKEAVGAYVHVHAIKTS